LDAGAQLEIAVVELNGVETPFERALGEDAIRVRLTEAQQAMPSLRVGIRYVISHPVTGFFFVYGSGAMPIQALTDAEPLDARHWLVAVDRPTIKRFSSRL